MKEYDKESWWEECKKAKPELTREEYEFRWAHFVTVTNFVAKFRGSMWQWHDDIS